VNDYVLDASAILTLLNEEPGKDKVEGVLSRSSMSDVNYTEVLAKLLEAGLSVTEATESVGLLGVEIVNFDADMARLTAQLRTMTRKLGLSLGDRSCLALGIRSGSTIVTADRSWARLKVDVAIEVIR